MTLLISEPSRNCKICPRLADYRRENITAHPDWFNGPAPSFGATSARLLIVGLAPGRTGANRTGRPFTGDHAGILLYNTLLHFGFASGVYRASANDGLELQDCMITNAVRCVPPGNRPTPQEMTNCRPYLAAQIQALPRLRAILTLGDVAQKNVLLALQAKSLKPESPKKPDFKGHGAVLDLGNYRLFHSYHCSRLNTQTGRLTPEMFHSVFAKIRAYLDS